MAIIEDAVVILAVLVTLMTSSSSAAALNFAPYRPNLKGWQVPEGADNSDVVNTILLGDVMSAARQLSPDLSSEQQQAMKNADGKLLQQLLTAGNSGNFKIVRTGGGSIRTIYSKAKSGIANNKNLFD